MLILVKAVQAATLAATVSLASACVGAGEKSLPPPPGEIIDEIVAIVNGEVITQRDVDEKFGQGTKETFGLSDAERERQWHETLLKLVVEKIKIQAAKKRDIAVQKGFVEDELAKNRAGRSEAEFRDIIDQQGFYTIEEYEAHLETLQLEKLFWWTQFNDRMSRAPKQRPSRSIEVRPDEVRAYYNENREKYRVAERARVSLIQVSPSKVGSREAAAAIVEELRTKIEGGADFAELARQNSSGFADQGGDLGWFERDAQFLQPIMEFAFSKPPGTLSPVIQSGDVSLLLRQDGYEPEKIQEFAEVSNSIKEQIRNRKAENLYSDIISELIRDAYIYPPALKERLIGAADARRK
jgi:parvulin-like peptidyl-prolyl isomerase